MQISVTDAKAQLTELVRKAEAGEEVILTRHGQAAVRLTPVTKRMDKAARRALIADIQASARMKVTDGPDAACSQDFLYDEDGLPA